MKVKIILIVSITILVTTPIILLPSVNALAIADSQLLVSAKRGFNGGTQTATSGSS